MYTWVCICSIVLVPLFAYVFVLETYNGVSISSWIVRDFKHFGKNSGVIPFFSLLRGGQYISIGNRCTIGAGVELTAWDSYQGQKFCPEIVFGDNCSIGEGRI
mgnify:CR=1 FL=1